MAEFELIARHFSALAPGGAGVRLGVGDDAAILEAPAHRQLVMTLDTLVAGRHFFPDTDPENLGHKALAVNLSDLAAMGAEPAWALLSLTLPEADEAWLSAFAVGFRELALRHGVALVGGDTCRGPLSIALQLTGLVEPGRALLRSGARPGDRIFVTGTLGDAALALEGLLHSRKVDGALLRRLERPEPRLAEGRALVGIASACIDISDGLVADLGHICERSGCAAVVQAARVPRSAAVEADLQERGDWRPLLAGGDDYELCFTVPRQNIKALESSGVRCTAIGEIRAGSGVKVVDESGRELPSMHGYDHFA
ncbi:MAG: thiamine-phosphate kinase [Gammaproteobacteria bacterium]|nr:MAG: thiamine-phosphate kinase [Gammaproteobacteria bacterium]